eukprot:COSAG06_NODE_2254_length_7230_cov_293.235872_2_plen_231_part_00
MLQGISAVVLALCGLAAATSSSPLHPVCGVEHRLPSWSSGSLTNINGRGFTLFMLPPQAPGYFAYTKPCESRNNGFCDASDSWNDECLVGTDCDDCDTSVGECHEDLQDTREHAMQRYVDLCVAAGFQPVTAALPSVYNDGGYGSFSDCAEKYNCMPLAELSGGTDPLIWIHDVTGWEDLVAHGAIGYPSTSRQHVAGCLSNSHADASSRGESCVAGWDAALRPVCGLER